MHRPRLRVSPPGASYEKSDSHEAETAEDAHTRIVEFIPDVIEEGKLYVSMEYATMVHKCACG